MSETSTGSTSDHKGLSLSNKTVPINKSQLSGLSISSYPASNVDVRGKEQQPEERGDIGFISCASLLRLYTHPSNKNWRHLPPLTGMLPKVDGDTELGAGSRPPERADQYQHNCCSPDGNSATDLCQDVSVRKSHATTEFKNPLGLGSYNYCPTKIKHPLALEAHSVAMKRKNAKLHAYPTPTELVLRELGAIPSGKRAPLPPVRAGSGAFHQWKTSDASIARHGHVVHCLPNVANTLSTSSKSSFCVLGTDNVNNLHRAPPGGDLQIPFTRHHLDYKGYGKKNLPDGAVPQLALRQQAHNCGLLGNSRKKTKVAKNKVLQQQQQQMQKLPR